MHQSKFTHLQVYYRGTRNNVIKSDIKVLGFVNLLSGLAQVRFLIAFIIFQIQVGFTKEHGRLLVS